MNPNLPVSHIRPLPQGPQAIEAAPRLSCECYHVPESVYLLPFSTPCFDPYIASHMHPLYTDRDQTQRHHTTFFFAKFRIPRQEVDDNGLPLDNDACELGQIYERLLKLYDNWAEYIQEAGAQRIKLWSQWFEECAKAPIVRSDGFVKACESTLAFLEEDHEKRKLDFVTEVYALLEKHDQENAKMVLDDLQAIWPGATINQVKVLEEYESDYAHVPKRKHFVHRKSDWGRGEHAEGYLIVREVAS